MTQVPELARVTAAIIGSPLKKSLKEIDPGAG